MPSTVLNIPAMGEGLQEARMVKHLKQPGEAVKRDEPLYEMETDKAVMAVESPVDAVIEEWLVAEDAVVPIGAEVVRVSTDAAIAAIPAPAVKEEPVAVAVTREREPAPAGNLTIPPRTRAYAKEKGIAEDKLAAIPAKGAKLLPTDIDAFLAAAAVPSDAPYTEEPLPSRQRTLTYRLRRGADLIIPGTIERAVNWSGIEVARDAFKIAGGEFQPSQYTIFAYGVAQAAAAHPRFRSSLPNDETLRTYTHINLGTAVALPGDELVTAVVPSADTLSFRDFAQVLRVAIEQARQGKDQASESTQLTITNLSSFGIRSGVPVLVAPAASVLFVGEPYDQPIPISRGFGFEFRRTANLSMTIDHRLVNGVGAASFMADVADRTENVLHYLRGEMP